MIAWWVGRLNNKDRATYYRRLDDVEVTRLLLLHIRQDLQLIAFVLMGIMVMLGVIADYVWLRTTG